MVPSPQAGRATEGILLGSVPYQGGEETQKGTFRVIRNRGKNVWQIRLEKGTDPATGKRGKPDYRTFCGTKREAELEEARLKLEIKHGTYVRLTKMTLAEYLDQALEAATNLRPRTREGYESIMRVHLKPKIGAFRLSDLRPVHLQQYYTEKRKEGLSERSVLHHHRLLQRVLDEAVNLQLIAYNPARRVSRPKPNPTEPEALSEKQLRPSWRRQRTANLRCRLCLLR
jgi:hypothetical protein